MSDGTMRLVHPGRADTTAYDAARTLEDLKLELEAVRSTALLLSTAEMLEETAQDAFRGVQNALDSIICDAGEKSDEFMEIARERSGQSDASVSAPD